MKELRSDGIRVLGDRDGLANRCSISQVQDHEYEEARPETSSEKMQRTNEAVMLSTLLGMLAASTECSAERETDRQTGPRSAHRR